MCYSEDIQCLNDLINISYDTIKSKFYGITFKYEESNFLNSPTNDALRIMLSLLSKCYHKELREYFSEDGLNVYIIGKLNAKLIPTT